MLADASYGKSGVRLVQVSRRADRDVLRDLTVAIRFEGVFTLGDKGRVRLRILTAARRDSGRPEAAGDAHTQTPVPA